MIASVVIDPYEDIVSRLEKGKGGKFRCPVPSHGQAGGISTRRCRATVATTDLSC